MGKNFSDDRYHVRAVTSDDRVAWLDMWSGYCDFYEAVVPEAITNATWSRIISAESPIYAVVATDSSTREAVGFANYVLHPFTWSDRPACYLEDLFVRSTARGTGAGNALLQFLIALSRDSGWSRLYWMTRRSNRTAQRLYDRVSAPDDLVRYVIAFDAKPSE